MYWKKIMHASEIFTFEVQNLSFIEIYRYSDIRPRLRFGPDKQKILSRRPDANLVGSGSEQTRMPLIASRQSFLHQNVHIYFFSQRLKWRHKAWHDHCFNCTQCNISLLQQSSASGKKKLPYCSKCYNLLFSPKCDKCNDAIQSGTKYCIDSSYQ